MKKVFLALALTAVVLVSCNKVNTAGSVESTTVDTVQVDTTAVDTVVTDTAAVK